MEEKHKTHIMTNEQKKHQCFLPWDQASMTHSSAIAH